MSNRGQEEQVGRDQNRRSADLLAISNQILAGADGDTQLVHLLKNISESVTQFSGCDIIRMVLCDHDRLYRCELNQRAGEPFRFDQASPDSGQDSTYYWSSGDNAALEQLCREIIENQADLSKPGFTSNGSFWSEDMTGLLSHGFLSSNSSQRLGICIDEGSRSMAILAVGAGNDRVGLMELESGVHGFFDRRQVEAYELICHSLGIGLAHRRLREALGERIKELTCLYGIAKLAAQPELSLEEVLLKSAELLPLGWLYPETCCARIVLDDRVHASSGYRKPCQSMRSSIGIHRRELGFVEVGYVWEKPLLDEGPFLSEERSLLDAVAHEVSIIVEQKQAADERSRLHEQLLRADRLATIGQLGAGLAHELNEPLASILGYAQLMAKDESLRTQTSQDLDRIVSASLHAREVIAKLLVFARDKAPTRVPIDLNVVIEESLYFFASRCAKVGVELSCDLSADLPTIMADRSELLQVLMNFAVNSIQAMPEGGHLTFSTECDGCHVLLTIEDTGTGMSSDVRERIFEPFFTTKDVDEGTGLGLSVVHGIVIAHGGTIDVESKVGLGAKFVVRLPASASHTQGRPIND